MTATQETFDILYCFVEEMNPDYEMVLDFCSHQGIDVTDDVDRIIDNLLWNAENE